MSGESDSDSSTGNLDDSYDRYDEFFSREESNSGTMRWVYSHRSNRSGEFFGNLPKRRVPPEIFKLAFNPTDKMLLEKAKGEIHNSINKARSTLSWVES